MYTGALRAGKEGYKLNKTAIGKYQWKNLTVHIKREYGQNKKLNDMINSLIMREISKNTSKIA